LELITGIEHAINNFHALIETQRLLVSALDRGEDKAAREARGQV
jgi:hypothetical protein